MGWDTNWVFEGLFMFGPPLNVWQFEIYHENVGYQPLPYYRLHMNIDNDPNLISRLDEKFKADTIEYYSLLRLLHVNVQYPHEFVFYKVWLYSLERDYFPSKYPYDAWKGFTLGVAFDKTDANRGPADHLLSYGY